MRRAILPLLLVVISLPVFAADLEGRWEGAARMIDNGVSEAWVAVELTPDGDGWKGRIRIATITLWTDIDEVSFDGSVLTMIIQGPGNPTFHGTVSGDKIEGDFRHGGKTFPFRLTRVKK